VWPLLGLGRKFRALGPQDMIEFLRTLPLSVWELLDDWFECAPLKAGVAAGGIQDFQQGPRSGGTGFVLLHHLAAPFRVGAGRVPFRTGPAAFTDAGASRGAPPRRHDAHERRRSRILVKDDAVTGVALAVGEEITAGAVLSTADPASTFLKGYRSGLARSRVRPRGREHPLPRLHGLRPLRARRLPNLRVWPIPRRSGDVVSDRRPRSLERAADAAKYGTVSDGRTSSSTFRPSLARAGARRAPRADRARAVRPVPPEERRWDAARLHGLAGTVTSAIEAVAPGFPSTILHRAAWSPRDLEEKFGLREGAASQGELALDPDPLHAPVAGWGRHATPLPASTWAAWARTPAPASWRAGLARRRAACSRDARRGP
jgi:hypothetical protein